MSKNFYTTSHVGKICGVTMLTVINWIEQGELSAYKTPGGHRRVERADLLNFLTKHKVPLPEETAKEGRCRILVVDDNKELIELVTLLIKRTHANCVIKSAMDGFKAGIQVILFKPDLVILDLKLPGIDGFEVCKQIKSNPETKHIKILAITGYSTQKAKQEILSRGADGYLEKPFANKEFVEKVKEMLTAGQGKTACAESVSVGSI